MVVCAGGAMGGRETVRHRDDEAAEHEGGDGAASAEVGSTGMNRRAPVTGPLAAVVLVRQGVALAAGQQVVVDRVGREEGRDERDRHADPEDRIDQARVHRAGDDGHDEVVDDLHREDRDGVGGQDEPQRCTEGQTAAQQGQARERVAEEEGQGDRQGDRLPLPRPAAVPMMSPRISPIAQPVRQWRVALAAIDTGRAAMTLVVAWSRGRRGRRGGCGLRGVSGVRCGCCFTHGLGPGSVLIYPPWVCVGSVNGPAGRLFPTVRVGRRGEQTSEHARMHAMTTPGRCRRRDRAPPRPTWTEP